MARLSRLVAAAFLTVLLGTTLLLGSVRKAQADEVAPDLEGSDLRTVAEGEFRRVFGALARNDQQRLMGSYVAFDSSASDPLAQVACDEDGDYVVVLSDAMLRLAAHVARADTYDEIDKGRKVEEYAGFVARAQVPGRRLLPPPPGFAIGVKAAATFDVRLAEALSFVVTRELTHLRAGDLVCPHPTLTKESGDEIWSASEQRKAGVTASTVYPGHALERDTEATVRMLETGRSERGGLALLRFFEQFEAERRVAFSQFLPTYLLHHPSSAARTAVVRRAVDARARDKAPLVGPAAARSL